MKFLWRIIDWVLLGCLLLFLGFIAKGVSTTAETPYQMSPKELQQELIIVAALRAYADGLEFSLTNSVRH